jgi:hypothetical protein
MIVTNLETRRVTVSVYGAFTLADYREFEEAVNDKIRFEEPVDLYFDLREMAEATLDVAWEDLRFSRAHANDFRRIAVVTDSQWVAWSAWLAQTFMSAAVEVFEAPEPAQEWLDTADAADGQTA